MFIKQDQDGAIEFTFTSGASLRANERVYYPVPLCLQHRQYVCRYRAHHIIGKVNDIAGGVSVPTQ